MAYKATIFSQALQIVPGLRFKFQKIVDQHEGDKRSRTLSCWTQLGAMIFGQLTGHKSLRGIEACFASNQNHLTHLGMNLVKRSTLSDANDRRDPTLLEEIFYWLLSHAKQIAPKHPFRFKGKVTAFDSTTISLCLSLSPWAEFRHKKGAFKLHTALDLAGNLPEFFVFTDGKVHDVTAAKKTHFQRGTTLLLDRGYIDFSWLYTLTQQDVFFVTRMKDNCRFKVRDCRTTNRATGVMADQDIRLTTPYGKRDYPDKLRRVSFRDSGTGHWYVFLTNRWDLSAKTICDLYKARWQVELFFKTLKGNLQVDKFVGRSVNAVLWQVWSAMIAYLLVAIIRFKNKLAWAIPSIFAVLGVSIFKNAELESIWGFAPRERCVNSGFQQLLLWSG